MLQSLDITSHMGFGSAISLLIFSAVGIAIPLPAGAGVWGTMAFGLQMVYNMEAKNAETFGIFSVAFQNLYCIFYGSVAYLLLWVEMQKKDAAENTVH
jgi:preprotein translocase subunit SecY